MTNVHSIPSTTAAHRKKHFWKKKKFRILLIVVIILVAIRIALPYVLLHYANIRLAKINGYYGHVDDLDLSLYRGAYKLKNLYIDKFDSATNTHTKFFDVKLIDLSLEWGALLHGKIVGKLAFDHPSLRFTKDKTDLGRVQKDTSDFRKLLKSFMPLRVNRCEITHGSIHYIDEYSKPPVDIFMNETYVLAQNLTNAVDSAILPSSINATANVYNGFMKFNMNLNPLANEPKFVMKASLENADLTRFNDFLRAYMNFDVDRGNFGLYMELAADNGKFIGYVKPFIKNLKVMGPKDRHDSILHWMWQEIVATAAQILKNHKHDQIATKIPLEGTTRGYKSDTWYAIADLIRNAFIQALVPSIDNEIDLNSVYYPPKDEKRSFLGRIFGKDKK